MKHMAKSWVEQKLASRADWFGRGAGPGPIGVDFRGGVMRAVQTVRGQRCEVVAAACIVLPDDRDLAADRVAETIRRSGFRGDACVIGLPFEAVRAETLTVPEGDDEAIRRELLRMAAARHDFAAAGAEADFLRLGPAKAGWVEVAAIFADRAAVESLIHPLVDRGLLPEAAEPGFIAAARACSRTARRASDRRAARIVVDLAADGGTVLTVVGEAIRECRWAAERADIAGAVAAAVHDGGREVQEVLVVGADAYEPSFLAAIESGCGRPVRLDDRMGTFESAYAAIARRTADRSGAAAWAGALGLSFRDAGASLATAGPLREAA
jgi:hypothetical protein